MSKSLFSIPILLFLAFQVSYAQPSMRDWLKVADAAYDTSDFYNAFRYYDAALKYKPSPEDSLRILFKYAESARQFNAFLYARKAYEQVLNSPLPKAYPLTLSSFWLAKMEQQLGLYDTAAIHYQYFIEKVATPGNREAEKLTEAQKGLRDCTFGDQELSKGTELTIDTMPRGINSVYSDFGAIVWNDTLYYTSFRFINDKDRNYLKQKRHFNKILTSTGSAAGVPLPDSINIEGDHVAHTAFNRDGSRMYYTICEYKDKGSAEVRCDLYTRQRNAKSGWSEPKKLTINLASATNTQPSVGYLERADQEVLFFASDRAGGQGGLDIWCGNINKDGDVVTAEAVREVNTPGNEVTPFFLNLTQTLYFSSDNREGMGGYDVYESSPRGTTWTVPKHVRFPVSTSYDDLYLSLKNDGTMGYLSSNRLGATLIDEDKEACCLDIFKFDMQVELLVQTCNQMNQSPLVGATVELYDVTGGTSQLLGKQTNAKDNRFNFSLMPGKKYRIRAMYEGFRTAEDSLEINTIEFKDRRLVEKPLCLGPPIELQVNTFKKHNDQPLPGAMVELYEATPSGEQLVATAENKTGNNFVFQVMRNKRYKVKLARPYYFSETESVDLTRPEFANVTEVKKDVYFRQELEIVVIDSSSRQVIANTTVQRQELTDRAPISLDRKSNPNGETFLYDYQAFDMDKRYRLVVTSPGYRSDFVDWQFTEGMKVFNEGHFVDTIPLVFEIKDVTLYFDHDSPDPKTRNSTTDKKYDETINAYYRRKGEFIRQLFGTDLSKLSPQDSLERARYENFFEREMYVESILNIERLAGKVFDELARGKSVELTIQGFCSPSGARGYNQILSERRIDCVENYLLAYGKNGTTMTDFTEGRNPKLKINKQPFGFDKVNPQIRRLLAGSRKDAVYNIAACLERKVVVGNVIIK